MKRVGIIASLLPFANLNNIESAQELSNRFKALDDVYQHVSLEELRLRF